MDLSIPRRALVLLSLLPALVQAQYTDVINSNRPGRAVGAYAIGTNVVQVEAGLFYEQRDHADLQYDANLFGMDYALRYGLFFEQLEINLEGTFSTQKTQYGFLDTEERISDFSRNRIGLKYLIFDPYKNPERNRPNLYSWRANNLFQWKNLIPAISLYGGANFLLGDNPFYPGYPNISYMGSVNSQSRLTPRMVLIGNLAYDGIGTDFPEWRLALSLSHAFRDPRWSIFVEGEGIHGEHYKDVILRTGVARLIDPDFQLDLHMGSGFKSGPSRIFAVIGASYRLDFHKDSYRTVDHQGAGRGGDIGRNANKKNAKNRKKATKKGFGW